MTDGSLSIDNIYICVKYHSLYYESSVIFLSIIFWLSTFIRVDPDGLRDVYLSYYLLNYSVSHLMQHSLQYRINANATMLYILM